MARYPTWAAFVVAVALAGCGPEKEIPTDLPKSEGATVKQQVVPATSEPEAKAVVDRAVKALTGGKPELLPKGKVSRVSLKGLMYSVDNTSNAIEATRGLTAVWPDRLHFSNESSPFGNKLHVESWLRRPDLIVSNNGVQHPIGNVADAELGLTTDVVGQHWIVFLLPATDPKAVLFNLTTIALERRELRSIHLSLGQYPIYQLMFDAKTDTLLRVEYSTTQIGVPRRTLMIFSGHKPGPDGFVLPHQIECLHNGVVVERWTVEKWELPDTIKDDEFSPPKKK